jgi:CheY-like chemotaxis protein
MPVIKKVFVVDDDSLYNYGIKRLFSKNLPENELSTFENAESALEAISGMYEKHETLPDVILLDLNMPGMNGWEFLKKLEGLRSKAEKDVEVYVISSQVYDKEEELYRVEWDTKVSDFIQKPVDANGILKLFEQK